jgi:hypothetical protein
LNGNAVGSHYLADPTDREIEIMLQHLDGVAYRDILSGEELPMKERRGQLQTPAGTLRVMDIEHRRSPEDRRKTGETNPNLSGCRLCLVVTAAGIGSRRTNHPGLRQYGKSEERLAESFLARFKDWGYNSSGYGPLPTMEKRIPYVATIWTEGPRSFSAGEKSRYTDIFDPAVQERLRKRVREATAGHVANRYCLGYVFIDLPVLLADTNTMTQRPEKGQADTADYERSAGEHTMAYYLDAAASKSCIGIHRCTVRDYQPWNPQYHRRGLLKADDTPYPILVDYTRRTNEDVYELVYQRGK